MKQVAFFSSVLSLLAQGFRRSDKESYNEHGEKMFRRHHHQAKLSAAPPCRLRLMLERPRAGVSQVPENSRPNLFGGD
jgi:hypothetical protein